MQTQKPPTPEICHAVSLLNEAIELFLLARKCCSPSEKFESDVESFNMMNLIIRNTEAVLQLAECDLVYLPAAFALSRVTYEVAIKILWMLDPDDVFKRVKSVGI